MTVSQHAAANNTSVFKSLYSMFTHFTECLDNNLITLLMIFHDILKKDQFYLMNVINYSVMLQTFFVRHYRQIKLKRIMTK